MVSAPYERQNEKNNKYCRSCLQGLYLKSILPTSVRFSRARSHITYVTFLHICIILLYNYTSRFASSSCGGPPVAKRPTSFAAHAHRKHLNTLISENTLIYSGNKKCTNTYIPARKQQSCISKKEETQV